MKDRQRKDFDENQKHYAAATGSICGTIVTENTKDVSGGVVSFLSTAGYSPVEHPTTSVNPDGSFCSERLGPGGYYLHFTRTVNGRPASAVFYPGVSARAEARSIEIGAGQSKSHLIFKVPAQKTCAVRGLISTNDKSGLIAQNVVVRLVNLDTPESAWYYEEVDFEGALPLPRVKYFTFGDVLPGHYMVYVTVAPVGHGWFTRKEDVSVATHMKFLFLDLVRLR